MEVLLDLRNGIACRADANWGAALIQVTPTLQERERLSSSLLRRPITIASHHATTRAFEQAATHGHDSVIKVLLSCHHSAPSPNVQNGQALVMVCVGGHEAAARVLLEWPDLHQPHGPLRADCQENLALRLAARGGHDNVLRLLLSTPITAPRADCMNGEALLEAARSGKASTVRLLLEWPHNAPRADSQGGNAIVLAAAGGHEEIVWLLMNWPQHAPLSRFYDGEVGRRGIMICYPSHSLTRDRPLTPLSPLELRFLLCTQCIVAAAANGKPEMLRKLLERPDAPRPDVQDGAALVLAAGKGALPLVPNFVPAREFTLFPLRPCGCGGNATAVASRRPGAAQ